MLLTDPDPLLARIGRRLPPTMPIPSILQTLACRQRFFTFLERCRARYGNRFTVYPMDMPPLVFLCDPDDIQEMIAAPPDALHPGAGGALLAPLIGGSSFMLCEEEAHKCGRGAIMPTFHRKVAEGRAGMVAETVEREVASWPLGAPFALHPRVRALTLKLILRAVLVEEDRTLEEMHERLLRSLAVAGSAVLQVPQLRHLPGWHGRWKRFVDHRAGADELIFAVIRRRRAEAEHGDLLDGLLGAHNPDGSAMTDQQLRDNLMSVILAGHETTTAELAWAFQLLAHNQDVQSRLHEEIDAGMEDPYMAATIDETLRHRPAFPFLIPRAVAAPTAIGGRSYRPPARLLGCTYLVHHDPALYPEPQAFRPERFLSKARQAPTWLPWGAGAKSCVGRHVALMEMQAVLREVLSTRVVLPASAGIERERWRSAVLVPHAGSRVLLQRRRTPIRSNRNRSVPIGTDF